MSDVENATEEFVYSTLGADPDLGALVELFVAEVPGRIEHLVRQYDDGDRRSLCRSVHQMKGAAGSYGFHTVTPVAAQLEQSLRNDGPEEQVKRQLDELLELCARLRGGTA